jgi:hypothetical protein
MDHVDVKTLGFFIGELVGVFAIVSLVFKYGFKSYLDKSQQLDMARQESINSAVTKLNSLVDEISKDNKDVRLKIVEVEKSIIELRVKLAENFDRRADYAQEQRHFVEVTNERLSAIEKNMVELKTELGLLVAGPRKPRK